MVRKPKPTVISRTPSATELKREALKQQRIDHANRIRPITITLIAAHEINGVGYGPGKVTVPTHIARDLLATDQQAVWEEINFRGTKSVIIQAGPKGQGFMPKAVPPEAFDVSVKQQEESPVDPRTITGKSIPKTWPSE